MAFRSATNAANMLSGASITLNKPSGCAAGDILIFTIGSAGFFGGGPGTPTGFTQLGTTQGSNGGTSAQSFISVFWRYCDGTEPSSWTVSSNSNGNQIKGGTVSCWTGRAASPIGTSFSQVGNPTLTASPMSVALTGITPAFAGSDLLWLPTTASDTNSNAVLVGPVLWTDASGGQAVTGYINYGVSYLENQPASATGTLTGLWTLLTASATYAGFVLALKPGGPTITAQPTNQTANAGATATFSVTATPQLGSVTYQWQDDSSGSFANIASATSSSYAATSVTYAMQGRQYRCVVSESGYPDVTTSSARLAVAFNLTGTGPRSYPILGEAPFGAGAFAEQERGINNASNTTATPGAGTITITGQTPTAATTQNVVVLPGAGAIVFTGQQPTVLTGVVVQPGAGSVVFSGQTPVVSSGAISQPGAGAVTFTGQAPIALLGTVAVPGNGTLVFTGVAPLTALAVLLEAGALTFTGAAPTALVTKNVLATPGAGAITFTGAVPAVVTGGNVVSQPGTGAVTITGQAPTAVSTADAVAQPPSGAVTITGQAPSLLVDQIVRPGAGSLLFTGAAPTSTASDNQTVVPGVGSVTFQGLAPTLAGAVTALPGAGQVTFEGLAPTVLNTTPADSVLDPRFLGRRKNVPFKPFREDLSPVFVPEVIDPPTSAEVKKAAGLDLRKLPDDPEPIEVAPPSAPKPQPKPKTKKSTPIEVVEPAVVPPAATTPLLLPGTDHVALLEVVRELVEQREAGLRDEISALREVVTNMQEQDRAREQKERNRRRAEEIAAKLLSN